VFFLIFAILGTNFFKVPTLFSLLFFIIIILYLLSTLLLFFILHYSNNCSSY
jgi:hypothetical protein